MITLAIFRQMTADGVAGLTEDKDFFWEEMPLQKNGKPAQGVWIVTRGGDVAGSLLRINLRTTVDFYVAFANKAKTEAVLREIQDWIRRNMVICKLDGSVGGTTYSYSNVRVWPTTTPQNSGVTENGLIVKMASAQLVYDEN